MFQGREDIDLENGFTRSIAAAFQRENSFLDEYQIAKQIAMTLSKEKEKQVEFADKQRKK